MPGPIRVAGGNAGLFGEPARDFGVSMRADVLEHKRRDGKRSDGNYCFWTMRRLPDGAQRGSKMWVASRGRWRGYFVLRGVDAVGEEDENPSIAASFDEDEHKGLPELQFHSEDWHEADGGPRSPFQGFTYDVPVI